MYYRLKKGLLLRGWELLPCAIVDSNNGRVAFAREPYFSALRLCNGMISEDSVIFTEEQRKSLPQMAQCGIYKVSLTGGEALVRKDFFDIVDRLLERAFIFLLSTVMVSW